MLKAKRQHIGISRLMHHASAAGLLPPDVGDEVMTDFITAVRERSLHRKPNDLPQKDGRYLERDRSAFPELGLRTVSVPSYRAAPCRIDLSLVEDRFKNDMEAYLAWCANTDPFAADARSRPLAPATIRLRHDQIHAALTALIDSGVTRESITALANLVTVPNFKKIAQRRLDMADRNTNSFNRSLVNALVQVAKEWVKTDAATLTELKRLAGKLPAPRGDLVAKNKRFLRQFDDPVVLRRLRVLPAKLWSKVRREKSADFRTLSLAQSALALEILIYLPIGAYPFTVWPILVQCCPPSFRSPLAC